MGKLNGESHSPFWALTGVMAEALTNPRRAAFFVESVGILEEFVAPDLHHFAVSFSSGVDGDLPKCHPNTLAPSLWEDIEAL